MTALAAGAVALGWLLLSPSEALAWGPGTHVALGEALLASLHLLPPAVAELLRRFPIHFLYGSVAADISFAKKYAPEGRHCHHWHVGEEILQQAGPESLQATAYGYLAHLAADTVAHNVFVPRQLLLTSSTQALGHTYWELRMDAHVGEDFTRRARRIVMDYDHQPADTLFDEVLSSTLFSFQTNRRIFRGMIRFQDHDGWRRVFETVRRNSRFDLVDPQVEHYLALSFDYVVGYFKRRHESRAASLDPIGDLNLKLAKKVRRVTLANEGARDPSEVENSADEFFPLPEIPEGLWWDVDEEVRPRLVLPAGQSSRPATPTLTHAAETESQGGVDPGARRQK